MEQAILDIIKTISVPGVIALGLVIVLKPIMPIFAEYLQNKLNNKLVTDEHQQAIGKVGAEIRLIGSNHLHEVKDLLLDIKEAMTRLHFSIEKSLDNQNSIRETLSYLRARLNGREN